MAEAEVGEVFKKCSNLFKIGRIRECLQNLETLTFRKYCVLELGQENNILICRYVNKKRCKSTQESKPQLSVEQAFENLHQKVKGIPLTHDNSGIHLLIAYNVCCLRLMSHDNIGDIKPDVTLELTLPCHMTHDSHLRQTCHLLSTVILDVFGLRLRQQKVESTSDEDTIVRNVISVLADSKGDTVTSKEEICMLLCLHSLILVLQCQRSEAREHLEVMLTIQLNPERLIVAASTERKELQLTEMTSSLLSVIYFSLLQWDKCLSVLTPQPSVSPHAVYMRAYVLYQLCQVGEAMSLLTAHVTDTQNQFTSVSLNLLGCCLSAQDKPYSAIEMLKRAAVSDPCYPLPLYNMALQYRKLGLVDAELETLKLLIAQLKNPELSSKKPCTVEFSDNQVRLSSSLQPQRELEVTLAQALYTLCKRCLELQRYQDAASGYRTLLTLLHQGHMTPSTKSCDLPTVAMATVYVETAYSLLCCGEFSDTVTVCQHLSGRSHGDVTHPAAVMYEVYALVGLGDIDVALSALDTLIDLIAPTVTATMVDENSPPPTKRLRSIGHPMECHDMRHLLENAYTYKSVLLLRNNQAHASLTCSRLAVQLNTGAVEVMYNHTLLLLRVQRKAEACTVWLQYRGITSSSSSSSHPLQMPSHHRKVPATEKGSRLLRELDESALKDLDDLCMILSRQDDDDVSVTMDVT